MSHSVSVTDIELLYTIAIPPLHLPSGLGLVMILQPGGRISFGAV